MAREVTVGIDIGTTSVKALAVDGDGRVVSRCRVDHPLLADHAGELAHPADAAWRQGVIEALTRLQRDASREEDLDIRGVDVAAMVPSLCAVDADGRPISPGLLYGDARGRTTEPSADVSSGEMVRFLAWLVEHHPDAAGYWPAQAVANAALGGVGAIDAMLGFTAMPLFDGRRWDPEVAAGAGLDDVSRLPVVLTGGVPAGAVDAAGGAVLGGGTVDAYGEQVVAGADHDGDVLVILGATLIVWAVTSTEEHVDGLWTIPHSAPGKLLMGGPSNAGGLFVNWVAQALGLDLWDGPARPADPGRVPVWQPYLRGERVPFHDPSRLASLHDLDIGMGPDALVRAAYEASAFAARHILDLSGLGPRRIVVTGGGAKNAGWLQALADGTGLPVDVVAVPEGAALGAAWLARCAAGLEPAGADGSRWARTDRRVEPDPTWAAAVEARYARYRELAGPLS
jgi:xylulokinase